MISTALTFAEILCSFPNPCVYVTQKLLLNLPNLFPPPVFVPVGAITLIA